MAFKNETFHRILVLSFNFSSLLCYSKFSLLMTWWSSPNSPPRLADLIFILFLSLSPPLTKAVQRVVGISLFSDFPPPWVPEPELVLFSFFSALSRVWKMLLLSDCPSLCQKLVDHVVARKCSQPGLAGEAFVIWRLSSSWWFHCGLWPVVDSTGPVPIPTFTTHIEKERILILADRTGLEKEAYSRLISLISLFKIYSCHLLFFFFPCLLTVNHHKNWHFTLLVTRLPFDFEVSSSLIPGRETAQLRCILKEKK